MGKSKKIKVEEILIFTKQFATMVRAGLPILQVLAMLRDQLEGPAIKEVVEDIRKSLEGGVTLSKCFEKYPQHFDNVYVNLIKAGEASGKLDVFLFKVLDAIEKASKRYFNQMPCTIGEGGTIPFMAMLGKQFTKSTIRNYWSIRPSIQCSWPK